MFFLYSLHSDSHIYLNDGLNNLYLGLVNYNKSEIFRFSEFNCYKIRKNTNYCYDKSFGK